MYFSDYDGSPVDTPSDLNFRSVDRCDSCDEQAPGIMYHAAGATGRVCAVMFVCDTCGKTTPPASEVG